MAPATVAGSLPSMGSGIIATDVTPFTGMVEAKSPGLLEVALASRALVFDVFPKAVEVVWADQGTAGFGTGPKKMTEQFVWLAPFRKHLVFGFYLGAELPDPAGLLEGTGARMRHVKVRSLDDVARPELRALVAAGVERLV
jgi:hypothetical protein